ncbi:MAG TPA: Rieske 2Fe-2S domain-containing protein, partial [Chloroflexota bacterium]|nr:Rieske 2Fe-2S domain-containing protein [Chloroflexota bacterium]
DCDPVRFRILSEDLIAFRDTNGKVGFLGNHCPHRGASLFFGRNEEAGLRCVYHGWKFDVSGQCVDMPNEPAESNFKNKVQAKAYPAAERGGLIWIYMGPKDKQPPLPNYYWCLQPDAENRAAAKWIQDSNYAQILEGNIDSAHISFLHRSFNRERPRGLGADSQHLTVARETDFGFVYGARRHAPDNQYYWRVTTFVFPTFTQIPSLSRAGNGIFTIPVDDEHTWWIYAGQNSERLGNNLVGRADTMEKVEQYTRTMSGNVNDETLGLIPGTWRKRRNQSNDFLIDREMQRTVNYTGLVGNRAQDSAVTESMGAIYDRTRERLGTTDAAIIQMRRQLIRLARQVDQGIEPTVQFRPEQFAALPLDLVTPEGDFAKVWEQHYEQTLKEAALV